MKQVSQRGSTIAGYLVVMLALVAVFVVVLASLERIRAYHDRSAQAMEIPL